MCACVCVAAFLDKLEVWPIIYSPCVEAAVERDWSAAAGACAYLCISVHVIISTCSLPECVSVWIFYLCSTLLLTVSIPSRECSFICLGKAECQGVATLQDFDHKTMVTQIKKRHSKRKEQLICGQLKLLLDFWCQPKKNAPRTLL